MALGPEVYFHMELQEELLFYAEKSACHYCSNSIKPPEVYLSETILRVGAYSRGGLTKFRGPQVYQRQYIIFNIKYIGLKVNRDGIKGEKVGKLFSPNISTRTKQ